MSKTPLEERQEEMREKKRSQDRDAKRRERLRKQVNKIAGHGAEVHVQVIPAGETPTIRDVKQVLLRLKDTISTLEGLTPEEIHEKVTSLTQVLHIKLQLQVSDCLDNLASADPQIRREAMAMVETLMPYVNQITELNVKMQAVLGLNENKGKLIPKRQPVALIPASTEAWETNFSDTLVNKVLN